MTCIINILFDIIISLSLAFVLFFLKKTRVISGKSLGNKFMLRFFIFVEIRQKLIKTSRVGQNDGD